MVKTLGSYWTLPEFRPKLLAMAMNDPDDMVRSDAISSRSHYYFADTRDTEFLKFLFQKLWDEDEDWVVRASTLGGIASVRGEKIDQNFLKEADYADTIVKFEELIPWKTLEEVLALSL